MLVAMLALAMTQGQVTLPSPTLRYKIEAKTSAEQDLTSLGRGKVAGTLNTVAFISVTMTDSAEGQVARIVVDSMKVDPTGAMAAQLPPAAAAAASDSARGASVRVFSVRGTIRGQPRPSTSNPALAPILQAAGVLFPGLRSSLKVGDAWADTTKIDNDVQGGHQTGALIATWKVTGMENGGFVLDGTASTNVTTKGQAGQSLVVIGTSTEHLVMASRGPTRNASIESVRDASTVQQQGGTPVPSKTIGMLKLTQIP